MPAPTPMKPCAECGMPCTAGEYHPYAACMMFKQCHNSGTVRENLAFVVEHGMAAPGAMAMTDRCRERGCAGLPVDQRTMQACAAPQAIG